MLHKASAAACPLNSTALPSLFLPLSSCDLPLQRNKSSHVAGHGLHHYYVLTCRTSNHIRTICFPRADIDPGDRDVCLRTLFRSPHERWVTGCIREWDPTAEALTGWSSSSGPGLSISTHLTLFGGPFLLPNPKNLPPVSPPES